MFFVMFGLIAIELPVAFALVTAALTWLLFGSPVPMSLVVQRMSSGIDSFPLLAIPLFVLAGNLMNVGGIAARIFEFAVALVGHLRGGLAQVNIFASLIFAGMSGVAQADAAGLGTVEIKAMKKEGFDAAFAAACSAASAIVGPIIPPSVIMVVYGVLAQVSISDLFLAGLVPGFFIGGLLMLTVWFLVATGRVYAPVQPKANAKALGRSFVRAIPPLMAPVILVAGLLSGVATPTELGAITVVYAIVLGFAYRELNWKRLYNCIGETFVTTGVLVFIMAAAVPFGWAIAVNNVPADLAKWLLDITTNKWVILALINVLLLVMGCFMETTAILLIAVPTFLPLVMQLGIDPIHFGLIIILNLLIGATTPPFGVLLFIVQDIAKVSFGAIVRAILPFYVPLGVALIMITYWPDLSLWLPRILK
ncbi:MAG: TRAP transporter large permease [Betaproteobacteria bacterium]|nr:TRAP transporter large permease [Betaproteobacteria bacterium]